jgi:hypothetical protein
LSVLRSGAARTKRGRVHIFNITGTDCNNNGIDDCVELASCAALDCNGNGIPDCCDLVGDPAYSEDTNNNGIPDECEDRLDCGASDPLDCNKNRIPDECERSSMFDVVFLIDESSSLTTEEWELQLEGITQVICGEPDPLLPALIDSNGLVRVAVVGYDNSDSCMSGFRHISLTVLDVNAQGGSSGSITPQDFCDEVLQITPLGSSQPTLLSGSLHCVLDILHSANDAYRRQVIIMGDGGIAEADGSASVSIADALRSLGSDQTTSGLSANVSFVRVDDGCSGTISLTPFQELLVNHRYGDSFRPCDPAGLWECGTPSSQPSLERVYSALRRMIFQNLLRCPDATEDIPICDIASWLWDCNSNGVPDCIDILTRTSLDADNNGYPDECHTCPGDVNVDFGVNIVDLLILLSAWGPCADPGDCPPDLNGSGVVDLADLLILLGAWGPCTPGSYVNPCTQQAEPRYAILPPQSIADCFARYSSDTEALITCIEAMALAGTP